MAIQEQSIDSVTAQPYQVRIAPQRGALAWALQRISAYGLVIFLSVHMWFNHFADLTTGNQLSFEIVNRRFYAIPVLYAINDIGLLTCTLFHGLNGVRNVVYDLFTSTAVRRATSIILLVIGTVALVDGSLTLLALMDLRP